MRVVLNAGFLNEPKSRWKAMKVFCVVEAIRILLTYPPPILIG